MAACLKGLALAMATLATNSIGLALSFDRNPFECGGLCAEPQSTLSLFLVFFAMGIVPCALAGVLIGWIAGATVHAPGWCRWLVLASLACSVAVMFAYGANLPGFAVVSTLPTLAAVTALERSTRARSELPEARAR